MGLSSWLFPLDVQRGTPSSHGCSVENTASPSEQLPIIRLRGPTPAHFETVHPEIVGTVKRVGFDGAYFLFLVSRHGDRAF